MAQKAPKYPHMASCTNPIIQKHLREKYGPKNICWPIVWIKDDSIQFYTYELTDYCDTNSENGNRPQSSSYHSYFVDYTAKPRKIIPNNSLLKPSVDSSYECSYDYVISSDFITVDLDYVWLRNDEWIALEFTTFYIPFNSRSVAVDKVCKINRRPSWKKGNGPEAILRQIEAANDLQCKKYIMACVNTKGQVSNDINVDGNAYWFDLDEQQVNRLVNGEEPKAGNFGSFKQFLKSL